MCSAADSGGADVGQCQCSAGRGCSWFQPGRTLALTRQFHQAEAADLAHLDAGTVEAQRIAQAIFDFALILAFSMSMKSITIRPPKVAQAQLASQFLCGFEVGLERGFLDVGTRWHDQS